MAIRSPALAGSCSDAQSGHDPFEFAVSRPAFGVGKCSFGRTTGKGRS
jgi:hypothetical protein